MYFSIAVLSANLLSAGGEPIDIGSRLELLVDRHLIDELSGAARQVMHHPTPRDVVIKFDSPWEGSSCGYHSIVTDGDRYRMYYRSWQTTWLDDGSYIRPHGLYLCYAESRDGIHWEKPELGLIEFEGSKKNNLVMHPGMCGTHVDAGHVTVFKDSNPNCAAEARYKALGWSWAKGEPFGLLAFASSDGLRWSLMQREFVISEPGTFDSQNLAFWDTVRGEYRSYFRDRRDGFRIVRTATSADFLKWSDSEIIVYPGAPQEQLYTNQIQPYYRAPHLFLGFPARYLERPWSRSHEALPLREHREMRRRAKERYGTALSDTLFMTSRDGRTFHRWDQAFLRPGPERTDSWVYGDHYLAWPLVVTKSAMEGAPDELSLYSVEGNSTGESSHLRRYTLRIDGFVSVRAPLSGGELLTRPLVFDGQKLVINFSSSAAGDVRVEIQDAVGKPLKSHTLEDCPPIFGDALERTVHWKTGSDVSDLAGRTVRLRFVLRDADLFSFRFR